MPRFVATEYCTGPAKPATCSWICPHGGPSMTPVIVCAVYKREKRLLVTGFLIKSKHITWYTCLCTCISYLYCQSRVRAIIHFFRSASLNFPQNSQNFILCIILSTKRHDPIVMPTMEQHWYICLIVIITANVWMAIQVSSQHCSQLNKFLSFHISWHVCFFYLLMLSRYSTQNTVLIIYIPNAYSLFGTCHLVTRLGITPSMFMYFFASLWPRGSAQAIWYIPIWLL